MSGQTTAMQNKYMEQMMGDMFKQEKTINDGKNAMIDQAEHKETEKATMYGKLAESIFEADPDVKNYASQIMNPGVIDDSRGGAIVGSQEGQTPPALESFLKTSRASSAPTINASGKFGIKSVTAKDNAIRKIQNAKDQGRPLLQEEQDLIAGQFGIKPDKEKEITRSDVMKLSQELSKSQYDKLAYDDETSLSELIEKNMITAEKLLKGEPISSDTSPDNNQNQPEKVLMTSPDGQTGYIPRANVPAARKQGFQLAN